MVNFLLALVGDFVTQNQKLLHGTGRVDGQPAHRIVEPVHGLVPRTDSDTAPATTGPFSLVHSPEDETFFGIYPPLAKTTVVVQGVGSFITGLPLGHCTWWTKFGAVFTGQAEFVGAKGNGFVWPQRQVRRDRL